MHERRDLASESLKAAKPYVSRHRSAQHRFSRADAALLVIDMQKYFLDRTSHAYLPESTEIVENVLDILTSCRRASMPVVFTRHAHRRGDDLGAMGRWWADAIVDGTELSLFDDRFHPLKTEKVLRKTAYNCFAGTNLERYLRAKKVSQLLITGVQTHLCCESTAREAFMKGFDVFFVVDGTASSTRDLHLASVKTLTDGFAIPVTTEEVLRWLDR